jgi:hypothetical protein
MLVGLYRQGTRQDMAQLDNLGFVLDEIDLFRPSESRF